MLYHLTNARYPYTATTASLYVKHPLDFNQARVEIKEGIVETRIPIQN